MYNVRHTGILEKVGMMPLHFSVGSRYFFLVVCLMLLFQSTVSAPLDAVEVSPH